MTHLPNEISTTSRWMMLLSIAGASLTTACSDESCSVVGTEQGVIITCPGEDPFEVLDCTAGLPDLDGDGEMTGNDCALAGVGAATRRFCETDGRFGALAPSAAWFVSPACRGVDMDLVEESLDGFGPVAILHDLTDDGSGLSMAYVRYASQQRSIVVRVDRSSDGRLSDETPHVLPTSFGTVVGGVARRDAVANEAVQVQVVFIDATNDFSPGTLRVWTDRNRDGAPSSDEIAMIETNIASAWALVWSGGLLVAYGSQIWWDVNGNGVVDQDEIESYASNLRGASVPGAGSALWIQLADGQILTGQDTNLDGRVSAAELSAGSPTCAVGTFRGVVGGQTLCTGSGTSLGDISTDRFYLDHGRNAVLFTGSLWLDTNSNYQFEESEFLRVRISDRAALLPRYSDFVGMAYVDNEVSVRLRGYAYPDRTAYLGEPCAGDWNVTCPADLECRVSGNAAEPHCVPPEVSADE